MKYLVFEATEKCQGYFGLRYIWLCQKDEQAYHEQNQSQLKVLGVFETEDEAFKFSCRTPDICLIIAAIFEAHILTENSQTEFDREFFLKVLQIAVSHIEENTQLRQKFGVFMAGSEPYHDFHAKSAEGNTLKARLVQAALDSSVNGYVHLSTLNEKFAKILD